MIDPMNIISGGAVISLVAICLKLTFSRGNGNFHKSPCNDLIEVKGDIKVIKTDVNWIREKLKNGVK